MRITKGALSPCFRMVVAISRACRFVRFEISYVPYSVGMLTEYLAFRDCQRARAEISADILEIASPIIVIASTRSALTPGRTAVEGFVLILASVKSRWSSLKSAINVSFTLP